MSKSRKPTGVAWGEASDELKAKVKLVLQMAQNNRYSVSRIYAAHNGIFGLKEQPETCSTCLTSREKNLRNWWAENVVAEEVDDARQPVVTSGGDIDLVATKGDKHTQTGGDLDALKAEKARFDKLHELGVTQDSSNEDTLEAYEVLAAAEDNSEVLAAAYAQQIELLTQSIAAANEVVFTPAGEGALYGNGYKGCQPLPEGVYEYEGKRYQVSGDLGRYTELAPEETGHDSKAPQVHFFKEGEMSMTFTPNADDVTKGVVAWQDGTKVKAGTYVSATGVSIAVQVGSKASIK